MFRKSLALSVNPPLQGGADKAQSIRRHRFYGLTCCHFLLAMPSQIFVIKKQPK